METTATAANSQGNIFSWVILIVMFAALYFLMIRPQNKREKEARNMRNSLKPGDNIITIGGICGTVARVKEDSDRITIMVGSERTKLEILKSAIAQIDGQVADRAPSKKKEDVVEETSKPNKKNIKKLGSANEEKEEVKEAAEEVPAEKAE